MRDDRFARHHQIPGFEQSVVSGLKIALIGAGAIGNEFLKNALLMGLGSVTVYDFDTTELSNLTRSVFLRETDIGSNKAEAVVKRAQELHPQTLLTAIAGDIADTLSLSALKQYDFLVCAVDNLAARLRINDMTLLTGTPWINLAIDARNTVVEVFTSRLFENTQDPPCYACGLPLSAYERLQARYSCGGLQRAALIEKKVPTTAITASTVAALGLSALLRLAHTKIGSALWPSSANERIFFDTVSYQSQRSQLNRQADCPACETHEAAANIVLQMPTQWQESSEPRRLTLSDAIIVRCACNRCGWKPDTTLWLGRRAKTTPDTLARCPHCQTDSIEIDILDTMLTSNEFASLLQLPQTQACWVSDGQLIWDRASQKGKNERH